jgi:hypothetical protein
MGNAIFVQIAPHLVAITLALRYSRIPADAEPVVAAGRGRSAGASYLELARCLEGRAVGRNITNAPFSGRFLIEKDRHRVCAQVNIACDRYPDWNRTSWIGSSTEPTSPLFHLGHRAFDQPGAVDPPLLPRSGPPGEQSLTTFLLRKPPRREGLA